MIVTSLNLHYPREASDTHIAAWATFGNIFH